MQQKALPIGPFTDYKGYADYRQTSKLGLIVPLYISMIAGTGGLSATPNVLYAATTYRNPIIREIRGHHSNRDHILSFAQRLSIIREMFGLRMSEVAQIFGVSRPAAYAWLNGSEPRADTRIRILRLSRAAEELKTAGIENIRQYVRQPTASGQSLIDLLQSGADVSTTVSLIKASLLTSLQSLGTKPEFGPPTRKRVVGLDEISTSAVI